MAGVTSAVVVVESMVVVVANVKLSRFVFAERLATWLVVVAGPNRPNSRAGSGVCPVHSAETAPFLRLLGNQLLRLKK